MTIPPSRRWPRGPTNELHKAAHDGSTERTVALLTRGVIDIDQGTPQGDTPLMFASLKGYSRIVRILLNKGANTCVENGDGYTALHSSTQEGHLAVTRLLVKAGADLEATLFATASTPLDLAAARGYSEVMGVLIEAGANPNIRRLDGSTPLYGATQYGHMAAVKVLLRAKANPLLTYSTLSGDEYVPLDIAAENGHSEVAHELIQEHGIEACGGASGGVDALQAAAETQQVEMMGMLTRAGVVDTGIALRTAVRCGQESSVKFLLQQQEWEASGRGAGYLDTCNRFGATPLVVSIQGSCPCSPRIARLLVDAGADTTTAVRLSDEGGVVSFDDTPLALADLYLSDKTIRGKDATESQLHSLEATRRLLMRVEAVHAVPWLWTSDVPSVTHAATEGTGRATKATRIPLMVMLPILRRRAGRPRVLLAALFRHSSKP